MIKSLTVTNRLGESLTMQLQYPSNSGNYAISSIRGLDPVKADINTTEMATRDGALYNSSRMSSRNIVLNLIFVNDMLYGSIEDMRQNLYKFFPVKQNVTITVEADNRIGQVTGYVESVEVDIFSAMEGAQISIICPDPYFYSAGANGINVVVFYGSEPAFQFPFSNESLTEKLIMFGYLRQDSERTITYNGDDEVGILIYIHALGEAENITIYNLETRESMEIDTSVIATLTGSGIVAGDDLVISTIRGSKSITLKRGGYSYNILNAIGKNTDWFQLTQGDNIFAFVAESGLSNLEFEIAYQIVYEGM